MDEEIFEEFEGHRQHGASDETAAISEQANIPGCRHYGVEHSSRRPVAASRALQRMWILRRYLSDRTSIEAMEFMETKWKTRDNDELLRSMNAHDMNYIDDLIY